MCWKRRSVVFIVIGLSFVERMAGEITMQEIEKW
jgi:hypothetical protein